MEHDDHPPVMYLDHAFGGLILEDRKYLESYYQLLPTLTAGPMITVSRSAWHQFLGCSPSARSVAGR